MNKAVIYFGATGNEAADQMVMQVLEEYCTVNGYEVVAVISENVRPEGMTFPMKFAFVGMAEVEDVDVVVTLMSDMVGDCEETIMDNIIMLGEHGITVETANDDIEQFFDKVNHDKLIQILREQVNDSTTLNLIRKYLKAGVMENGLEKATITGVPQGGPLSVVCSNVYLDKLDKELEHRGLRFTRYADDVLIFTKSEMAANRVMNSISDWLERKLFLKVNATKTKVVRPMRSKYLGFTFLKNGGEWKVKPTNEKKKKLKKKLCEYLKRGKAIARPLVVTIKRVNEIVRGWINYFRIGLMKQFVEELGQWLRHKIRMIVMKQWKKPKTIYRNLSYLNWKNRNGYSQEDIHKVANSRLGWYRRSGMNVVNFIISKDLLGK